MIARVGAWGGRDAVRNPTRTAAQVVALGLTDVSLCVESQWNAADGTRFDPFVPARDLAKALDHVRDYAADQGKPVRTHVLMYPQADAVWAADAVEYLSRLDDMHHVDSVEDDAEENWSARSQDERELAASAYRRGLQGRQFRRGVTGITYANFDRLEPLTHEADYFTMQGYSSTIGKIAPGRAQRLAWDRWRRLSRDPSRHVMGLAAYGQQGAGNLSAAKAMRVAWDATDALGITEARYWSLGAITGPVARFIAERCAAIRARG